MRQVLVLSCLAAVSACGDPDMAFMPCTVRGSDVARYRVVEVLMPASRRERAFDLDGDGTADNRLGDMVYALRSVGVDPVEYVAAELAAGTFAPELHPITDGLWREEARGVGARFGEPDRLAGFCGDVSLDRFTSVWTGAVSLTMRWPFLADTTLTLSAAQLSFAPGNAAIEGQLNGAFAEDQWPAIHRGIAVLMTEKIQGDPSSALAKVLRDHFDLGGGECTEAGRGGCRDSDGTCRTRDGVVSECEVRTSSIIGLLLDPDVTLCDAPPCGRRDGRRGISFGVGFRAQPIP